ncbi:uncharacterized protein VTP21DRAFT_6381 [Calcarisporiella thermophila]|uniref:uncharacterized protein n=1 Tax=Calcarisporiella thermophila TaxID=911321 RepID=UPI003743FBD4
MPETAHQRAIEENIFLSLPEFTITQKLEVEYQVANGVVALEYGTPLTATESSNTPTKISWNLNNEEPTYYTLLNLDLDAPLSGYPFLSPIAHLILVNIPASSSGQSLEDLTKDGYLALDYTGAHAPPFVGYHRYVYLLLRQSGKIEVSDEFKRLTASRFNFKYSEFLEKFNLTPVAVNWFRAQNNIQTCNIC